MDVRGTEDLGRRRLLLIRVLNQLESGLPFFRRQGTEGEQAQRVGVGVELVTAQGVAEGKVGLAGVEMVDAITAMDQVGRERVAKQAQVAAAAAAGVGPVLESATGRATHLIG